MTSLFFKVLSLMMNYGLRIHLKRHVQVTGDSIAGRQRAPAGASGPHWRSGGLLRHSAPHAGHPGAQQPASRARRPALFAR